MNKIIDTDIEIYIFLDRLSYTKYDELVNLIRLDIDTSNNWFWIINLKWRYYSNYIGNLDFLLWYISYRSKNRILLLVYYEQLIV